MKQLLILSLLFVSLSPIRGQLDLMYSSENLDINDVQATIYSCGLFFDNGMFLDSTGYLISPSDGLLVYNSAFWVGGLNPDGDLHLAAETFKTQGPSPILTADYWHGPIADNYDEDYDLRYNKVWKINKSLIDNHILNYNNEGYVVPDQIADWPAHGLVENGESEKLAPFLDINGNDIYDPENGDYPAIKGDQTLFIIYNDVRLAHSYSGGENLGIEIHAMLYAYNCPDYSIHSLNETSFINLKIIHRGNVEFNNLFVSYWADYEIGGNTDDNIGCDSTLNVIYALNGDNFDEAGFSSSGFGENPPAFGTKLLNNNFSSCIAHNIFQSGIQGHPLTPDNYYNYMQGYWLDGSSITLGGNGYVGETSTSFLFDSPPSNENGWSMNTAGVPAEDLRGIGSVGPLSFSPGDSIVLDYAFIYARGDGLDNFQNVDLLLSNAEEIQNFYDGLISCSTVGVQPIDRLTVSVYPNPCLTSLQVEFPETGLLQIYGLGGKLVYEIEKKTTDLIIDVSTLNNGMYYIVLGNSVRARFVKE